MSDGTVLPTPDRGRERALEFVERHLGALASGPRTGSGRFVGGQRAADAALDAFDVTGYARRRNQVLPTTDRGASALSPYIRHGILPLRTVWEHVAGGPSRDVDKFRDELLWQEYARHWYARLGSRTRSGVRRELDPGDRADEGTDGTGDDQLGDRRNGEDCADADGVGGEDRSGRVGWDRSMACIDAMLAELEHDGWLVNQARMWLASEWAVRRGARWQHGEDEFIRHLLDGSRAANRLGWQWTTGTGSSKHSSFSRWQVRKRAPELCDRCALKSACPIEDWPSEPSWSSAQPPASLRRDDDVERTAGPPAPIVGEPERVWLTAESLGIDDPALAARPDLPAVFVFDRPLLHRLRLTTKRLVFLVETLAEIAEHRDLRLVLGDPADALAGHRLAVTFAPVPGFRRIVAHVEPVEVHPARWLVRPHAGSISSFSAWRKGLGPIPG